MRMIVNAGLAAVLMLCASPALPQALKPDAPRTPGTITGTIVDGTGAGVARATVSLSQNGLSPRREVLTREDGQFTIPSVSPGPFRLTVSAPGFAEQTLSGVLDAGQVANLPPIRLTLAFDAAAVEVTSTRVELAEQQIKEQEQQRLFGVLPNFYVTYNADAVPLTTTQKFELSWKTRLDPVQFVTVGITAGVQQARGDFSGFGDGAEGYAKRYAAAYATIVTRSLVTQVLFPSLFKQDPRYFYKGTGTTTSRVGYAVSRVVIRKGDNGRWQPNYSGILGSLASGALSNLYYPAEDRKGVQLTLENTAIGLAGAAAGHLFQEFLFRRLTSHSHKSPKPVPQPPEQRSGRAEHMYGAPEPVHGDPEPLYAAPEHAYRAPEHAYRAPEHVYKAPEHVYKAPEPVYAGPEHEYAGLEHEYAGLEHEYAGLEHEYAGLEHA